MKLLVTGHPKMIFGGIWNKRIFFSVLGIFWPVKNWNFIHWTLSNYMRAFRTKKISEVIFSFFSVFGTFSSQKMQILAFGTHFSSSFWQFWSLDNSKWLLWANKLFANFGIFDPPYGYFWPPNMLILVVEPQMTWGAGNWAKMAVFANHTVRAKLEEKNKNKQIKTLDFNMLQNWNVCNEIITCIWSPSVCHTPRGTPWLGYG